MADAQDAVVADRTVDIASVVCPVTFVKAKMAMEKPEIGQTLAVRMNDGEAVQNVPCSFKDEGLQVWRLVDNGDGTWTLLVRKASD